MPPEDATRAVSAVRLPGPDSPIDNGSPRPARVQAVVATRSGHHLDETLQSLTCQTWPELSVTVVSIGNPEVDPTPSARRRGATVLSVSDEVGLAGAAQEILADAGFEAGWRLFCEEGAILDPDCLRLLVESAEAAGAGVAGPKLLDSANPEMLREVGLSADRFGVAFTPVDPGEIDHGQHDGTREVLFMSTSCLLVRADLFERLRGFDATYGDRGIDLDFCWRARIADGPVIVVPEAVVHVGAESEQAPSDRTARNRLRTVLKTYSLLRLVWVLIEMAVLSVAEIGALMLARRGREASYVLGAWWWNLRHLPSTIAMRWRVQRKRATSDKVVKRLQVSGSARVREYLESRMAGADRGPLAESASGGHLAEELRSAATAPQVLFWLVTIGLVVVGARSVLVGVLPDDGQVLASTPMRGLLSSYLTPWRFDGLGAPGGGPVHLALFALVRVTGFGSISAGLRVLLVGGYLAGLVGAWRAVARLDSWPAPGVAVAVYALSPVLFAATEAGDLGAFWMWCLTPFLVARILDSFDRRVPPLRSTLGAALMLALIAALHPLAPLVFMATATALLLGSLLGGGAMAAMAAWARAVLATLMAAALLVPTSLQWVGVTAGGPTFRPWYLDWKQLRVAIGAGEAIRLQVGSFGGGVLGAAPVLAALVALLIARRQRLEWAIRLWAVALSGMAAAFLAGQDILPASPRAFPGVLAGAAFAVAALCGLAAAAASRDLYDMVLGWRHAVTAVVGLLLALSLIPGLGRLSGGRLGLDDDRLRAVSSFLTPDEAGRVLWLGTPASLPGDALPLAGQLGSYTLTRGRPDIGDLMPSAPGRGDEVLAATLELIRQGNTRRGGSLLAPFGIRWVVVVMAARPARIDGPGADPNLVLALGQQLDLAEQRVDPGRLVVYRNDSVVVGPSLLPGADLENLALKAGGDIVDDLQSADLASASAPLAREGLGGYSGAVSAPAGGIVLLQERFDPTWAGLLDGRPLEPQPAFGWAQGFRVPAGTHGRLRLDPSGTGLRIMAVLGQASLWIVTLVAWRRRSRRDQPASTMSGEPSRQTDEALVTG